MLKTLILGSTIITLTFSFTLGLLTLIKNPRSKVNITWFLTMMAIFVWTLGYTWIILLPENFAMEAVKVVYIGATFAPILFFHFVMSFLYKDHKFKIVIMAGYVLMLIFLYLTTLTSEIIDGVVYLNNFGFTEKVVFPAFYFYVGYHILFSFLSLFFLIKGIFQSDGIRKRQILYITLAALVAYVGTFTNLNYSVTGVYPYGQLLVWIFPLLITYGIFIDKINLKIKF